MAILDVVEYQFLVQDLNYSRAIAGAEPNIGIQQLAIGAGSVPSAAFQDSTRFVRLHADAPCRVLFGANPTAAAGTSFRLAAGQTEYFGVRGNSSASSLKVAVITST